jgi:CRP-like cAMP-binding protein
MEQDILEPFFNYMSLFTKLTNGDRILTRLQVKYRKVSKGEVLLKRGEIAKEVFFVFKGLLKTVVENEDGEEVIKYFHKENRLCTDLRSFNLSRRRVASQTGIVAVCDSELYVISDIGMDQLVIMTPHYKQLFNTAMVVEYEDNERERKELLSNKDTCYRKFLIKHPDIAMRVTIRDIMSYLEIPEKSYRSLEAYVF